MKVKIIPHTKHLHDRMHQHGEIWNVISRDDVSGRVLAQSQQLTFIGISGEKEHDLRWLNLGDFEIID